jgi:tripartite-type tricarboxylate transporter receptor subunit TctC
MWRRALVLVSALFLAGIIMVHPVAAQVKYPTQTVEVLCPFSAGGSFDLYSRLVATTLSKYLGQSMVVINKPGGAGTTVVADMINSKPDGYKMAILDAAYFSTVVKAQKVPFKPTDVVPLNCFLELKLGLVVKGDAPWKTLKDVLDYAKQNKDKFRFGHAGRGLTSYMNTRIVFEKAGATMIDVPYKGAAEGITALLGGHMDGISFPHGAVVTHTKSGAMRYLVVYSDKRYSDMSDIPNALELGFPDAAKLMPLLGIWVHKDTPQEIKTIITNASKKMFEDPAFKEGIIQIGDEPAFGGPERMLDLIKVQEQVSVPILKELGLYVGN